MSPAGVYYTTERDHSIRAVVHSAFFVASYGKYRDELKALGLKHWGETQRLLVEAGELIATKGGGVRVRTPQDSETDGKEEL